MIVFDLKCSANHHVFEAWFGSSADYDDQRARGLLQCPMCGDMDVGKALMAPAVSAQGNSRSVGPVERRTTPAAMTPDPEKLGALMKALAQAQDKALEGSNWVGRDFAAEARAMHYGEKARESIHGEVAPAEARALIQEGVEVAPLPLPVIPPHAKN